MQKLYFNRDILISFTVGVAVSALVLYFTLNTSPLFTIGGFSLIILISALLTVVMPLYALRNRHDIKVFSPYFFPIAIFTMTYVIPSIIIGVIRKDHIFEMALYLQAVGIGAYLIGTLAHKIYANKYSTLSEIQNFFIVSQEKIVIKTFLFLGLFLLVIYGLASGVTTGLLNRFSVEGIRRSAEIGKGYIKEPGVFFTTISTLWLLGINFNKKNKRWISGIFFLISVCFILFITTGHMSPAFWLLVFAVGLYNKYYKINLFQILMLAFVLFASIGIMTTIRNAGVFKFSDIISSCFVRDCFIYDLNYQPLIKLVDLGALHLQYGKEYLQNAAIIIPRFLWTNKPVNFDYLLKEILGLKFVGGGAPATIFGSLYVNFGFMGVALGMVVIGFLYRLIYQIYLRQHNLLITIISLHLLSSVINPSYLLSALLLLVFFILIILFVNKISLGMVKR